MGSSLFLGLRPPQTPQPVPASSTSVTSENEKAPPAPPVTESSSAVESASTQSATPAATQAVEDPLASLWGFWSVETIAADIPAQQEGAVEIRQEGSNIVIASSYKQLNMIGPIHGQQLQMIWNYDFDHETVLSGTYTPNAVSFQLSGKIGKQEQLQSVVYVFKRMKGTITAEQKKLRMLREEEVKAIYSALEEFKKSTGGVYPKRLEDAARFFKGDVALLTSSPEREVIYKPENQVKIPVPSSYPPLQWDSEVQYADQIVAAEAHMHEAGLYNYLFQPALVTVKYQNPTQRIAASSFGHVKVEVDETQLSDVEATNYCASCQNNLKQLGLVERMFANENHDYISGGWAMVYPEYVSDTAVLSCPCRPIGDDSYELLYPAVNTESFCLELCEKAGEKIDVTAPDSKHIIQSKVPMIMERSTHTINGKQGRNVLFFDGHAEFIAMNDLANKVYRFVKANK